MTIEFRCSQCNQLLRVPDTAAGKNARCPKCQALMLVPATSVAEPPLVGGTTGTGSQAIGGMPPASSDPFAPLSAGGAGGIGGARLPRRRRSTRSANLRVEVPLRVRRPTSIHTPRRRVRECCRSVTK